MTSVAFSPDGSKAITTGAKDKNIIVWLVPSGTKHKVLSGHDSPIRSISFFADGLQVLSKARNETRVWNVATGDFEESSSSDISLYPSFKTELALPPCSRRCKPVSLGLHLKRVVVHQNGKVAYREDGDRVHIFHLMRGEKSSSSLRPAEIV